MERRKFLGSLSTAGLLSGLSAIPGVALARKSKPAPIDPDPEHKFLTAPYLQNPTPNSMNVMWITSKPSYSWVEYGESALDKKAQSSVAGLVQANNRINSVQLEGLKPGTRYKFRVGSKDINYTRAKVAYSEALYSDVHEFTTPPANPKDVTILILNDIHDRPESIPLLMNLNKNEPFDFVFFNGDIFNNQLNEQQIIDHMLQPCTQSFASGAPFMMVRGNHETRGPYSRDLSNYFTHTDDRYYRDFAWGPVHFLVLDTGEDKEDGHEEYFGLADFDAYRREQAAWAEGVMKSKAWQSAAFRVVFMHIPHIHSGDKHGTMHCREIYSPLFEKYKVDMTISGHTHKYGVWPPEAGLHSYPIIIGGGPLDTKRTITRLKANAKKLEITMLRDDGVDVGRYALTR